MTSPPDPSPEDRSGSGSATLGRLGRRLLAPLLLLAITVSLLGLLADGGDLLDALAAVPLPLVGGLLLLSLVNYGLRFARWEMFLRRSGVSLEASSSLLVFLAGFVLSVTPGKAGELGKAWLVRELGASRARQVVPAVVAERVTDLLGVFWMLALGALFYDAGIWLVVAGAVGTAALALLLVRRSVLERVLAWTARLPLLRRRADVFADLGAGMAAVLGAGSLLPATLLSVVAWSAEGLGLHFLLRLYSADSSLLFALFSYAASTLAGALSMLPGGLLASEGALTALLGTQGLTVAQSASATLVIRGVTLWFAVLLGLLAVPPLLRRLRRRRSASSTHETCSGRTRRAVTDTAARPPSPPRAPGSGRREGP